MVGVKATEVSGFFGGGTAFGKCAVGVAAGEGMGLFGGVCGCHVVWLGGCGVGDVECGGSFRGEECWVGGDVECEGKESWKKVGRKVGSTCKWEVVVVVFVVVGVDLFVFLPLCSVVTALPYLQWRRHFCSMPGLLNGVKET